MRNKFARVPTCSQGLWRHRASGSSLINSLQFVKEFGEVRGWDHDLFSLAGWLNLFIFKHWEWQTRVWKLCRDLELFPGPFCWRPVCLTIKNNDFLESQPGQDVLFDLWTSQPLSMQDMMILHINSFRTDALRRFTARAPKLSCRPTWSRAFPRATSIWWMSGRRNRWLHARCSFWIISILKVQNWVYTQRTDSRMSSGFGPSLQFWYSAFKKGNEDHQILAGQHPHVVVHTISLERAAANSVVCCRCSVLNYRKPCFVQYIYIYIYILYYIYIYYIILYYIYIYILCIKEKTWLFIDLNRFSYIYYMDLRWF